MVDRIQKVLDKLNDKERQIVALVLRNVRANIFAGYDVKKLKGYSNVYRIRKGQMRIIYRVDQNREAVLLAVERRGDTTYNLHNF